MTVAVYLSLYAGLLLFAGGSVWRAWRYARLPLHLRWELYPVPHEEPRRARYGGSYFEEQEWWRKKRRGYLFGEWLAIAEEILLLKSLRESNRPLWMPSFLFHFGIYLEFAALALAVLSELTQRAATVAAEATLAGAFLTLAGATLLLIRRVTERALRNSTAPADFFNLLFFLAAFGTLAGGYLFRGPGSASLAGIAHGALRFDRGVHIGEGFGIGLMLVSALAAYIPFTHMVHYVAKYFTWHAVRWDDRRSEPGSQIEMEACHWLNAAPTWAAPHVEADGKRTWEKIAAGAPPEVR